MVDYFLPRKIDKPVIPPLKCQGIKTKLVNFIATSVKWQGHGKWIEPFLGSRVVLFNIKPERAIVSDTNKHIISFYLDLQNKKIDERIVKDYLELMGRELLAKGEDCFYSVREQFNLEGGDSLRFLFLNRCCYNGLMRFNGQGKFNVPFGRKPERFRQAYITKIVNQVANVRRIMKNRDWTFQASDWRRTMNEAKLDDFVYMDPPYIGRHTDYYNNWTTKDAIALAEAASNLKCGFALSMWKGNKYRENQHLDEHWNGFVTKTFSHFYHVGSQEKFRNEITEALVLKPQNAATRQEAELSECEADPVKQLSIFH